MAFNPYYAPYQRPMGYYNPSIPQENPNIQSNQQFQQMPIQQQMPMQQTVQPIPQTPTNDMLWVLSEVEATSFPVAPNNSVTLWDKNQDTVYIKSVNIQGVPSMRILDYIERNTDNAPKTSQNHECQCGNKFVSKEQFQALQNEITTLRGELEELKAKPKAKTAKKIAEEVEDNG
jgi:hypothetical protein